MFLDLIRRRNPRLIEAAIALHQRGQLPANTYVIDLDAVEDNARAISTRAELARPDRDGDDQTDGAQRILLPRGHAGRNRAQRCGRSGMRVGHEARGHGAWAYRPPRPDSEMGGRQRGSGCLRAWWTVFNAEKAAEAAAASERLRTGAAAPRPHSRRERSILPRARRRVSRFRNRRGRRRLWTRSRAAASLG